NKIAHIRHEDGKWVVYSHDFKKKLGTYDTETAAKKRLREIEYFKHKGSKVIDLHASTFERMQRECPDCYKKFVKFARERGMRINLLADDSNSIEEQMQRIREKIQIIRTQVDSQSKEASADSPELVALETELKGLESQVHKEEQYQTPRPTTIPPTGFTWAYDPQSGQWELVAMENA
ncbi:MAG: hypothetical protein ACREBJ_13380, partial [Nitrosotalea sp.]